MKCNASKPESAGGNAPVVSLRSQAAYEELVARRTAFHEAGHATASVLLRAYASAVGLGAVSIIPNETTNGRCLPVRSLQLAMAGKPERVATRIAREAAIVMMAGFASEMLLVDGEREGRLDWWVGDQLAEDETDYVRAVEIISAYFPRQHRRVLANAQDEACTLILANEAAVGRVAAALLDMRMLDGFEAVAALVDPGR